MSFTHEDAVDLHSECRVPLHFRRRSREACKSVKNTSLSLHDLFTGRLLLRVLL